MTKGVPFVCCNQNKETGSWCCPEGFTCGDGTGKQNCICNGVVNPKDGTCSWPPDKTCGKECCREHEKCESGECVPCEDEDRCGTNCCAEGSVCRNTSRSLCCVKTWKACAAGAAGVVKCCPPVDECCFNTTTKTATCCDKEHLCVSGVCKCKKDTTPCGKDCCEKTCCDGNSRICVQGKCCPSDRFLGKGKSARCCPPGTVAGDSGTCCPENDPECCTDGEFAVLCKTVDPEDRI